MKLALVDIFPVLLAALFVIGIKPVKPFSSLNAEYLSINTGKSLRGLFAVSVLFHHLSQVTHNSLLFGAFSHIGYLCVGLFFFLSGFGLEKSYLSSENYKKKFLIKRIPPVLFPYIAIMAIYCVFLAVFLPSDDPVKIWRDVLDASNSWYIISILLFYLAFWLLMIICKKHYAAMLIGAAVWFAAYVAVCKLLGLGSWWYNASVLLIIGMAWAIYEDKIIGFIKKHYYLVFAAAAVCFAAATVGKYKADKLIPLPDIKVVCTALSAVFFVICVLLVSMKFKIGNRALTFLGEQSLEIYLIHGIFILAMRNYSFRLENDFLFVLIAVCGSIVLAFALHMALKPLLRFMRKR